VTPNFLKRTLAAFGILEQEAHSAILMALYFFFAMSAVSITKSVQNALYLGRVGFDWKLPFLYLLLALVSMAVVALMGWMAQRYSRIFLNASTLIFLTFCFFFFLLLLDSETPIAYPMFYVFGGVFSVLVPTQGWMLSYELYSYRQAKRLFSLLGYRGHPGRRGRRLLRRSHGLVWDREPLVAGPRLCGPAGDAAPSSDAAKIASDFGPQIAEALERLSAGVPVTGAPIFQLPQIPGRDGAGFRLCRYLDRSSI